MGIALSNVPWDHPFNRLVFYGLVLCIAVSLLPSFLDRRISLRSQRRIFWSANLAAALCGYFLVYPNWKGGIAVALFAFGVLTFTAYFYSPYIKIGGKIYAFTVQDTRAETPPAQQDDPDFDPAPDAYIGTVTAQKFWWLFVPSMAIFTINTYFMVVHHSYTWSSIGGTAMFVILALAAGAGDASWEYPIARGQYVQFGILTVITAGSFAALYLAAYWAGKRRPIRLKRSMEYRAHPRHQK